MSLPRIPILLYHQILNEDRFRGDMNRLHARGWRCLAANDAAELTLAGKRAAKTFALTFDDGFRDFADLAHPILRDLGFTATVFIVTDRIGGRADWTTVGGELLLDADEIRRLVREGVSFGSHSRTHAHLLRCSAGELLDELSGSRTALSDVVGSEVTTIAWPYGENDSETRRVAAEAGYRLGYAVAGDGRLTRRTLAALQPSARDRFAVPRREVRDSDSPLRRQLRMGPADGLFVAARKVAPTPVERP